MAVEDSTNGLRSARGGRDDDDRDSQPPFPPAAAALNQAAVVIESLQRLRPELPDRLRLARS